MQLSPQEVQVVKAIRSLDDGVVELYVRDGMPLSYSTRHKIQEIKKEQPPTIRCEEKH